MGESSGQLHYLQTFHLWEISLFQFPCFDFSGIYMLLGDDSGRPHPDPHCPEEKEDGEVIEVCDHIPTDKIEILLYFFLGLS